MLKEDENLIDNPEDTDIEIINDLLVGTLEVENVGDSENDDDDGSDLPTVQIPIAINLGDDSTEILATTVYR